MSKSKESKASVDRGERTVTFNAESWKSAMKGSRVVLTDSAPQQAHVDAPEDAGHKERFNRLKSLAARSPKSSG